MSQLPYALTEVDTVLFDLDGTLVDNFTAIHRCAAEVAVELGFPPMTLDAVKRAVGGSITVTMSRLLPAEVGEQAVALYRKKFPAMMFDGMYAYDGVEALVRSLHAKGYKTAVFTNKDADASRKIIERLGFDRHFHKVIGTGESPWRKPEAEFTRHALELLGASPSRTVMIGDSPFDIAAARNGGLRGVYCVTTGSHDAEQLSHDKPDGIFPGMQSLGAAVFGV